MLFTQLKTIIKYAKLQFSPEDIAQVLNFPDIDKDVLVSIIKDRSTKIGDAYHRFLIVGRYEAEEAILNCLQEDAAADKQLRARVNARKIESLKSELFGL